jgi:hypothetical protein
VELLALACVIFTSELNSIFLKIIFKRYFLFLFFFFIFIFLLNVIFYLMKERVSGLGY